MNIREPDKVARIFIILIIVILGSKEIYFSLKYSNGPSRIADDVTEVVVLRSGECYAKYGFLSNAGLPDYWCGCNQFPEYITEGDLKLCKNPPGKAKIPPDVNPEFASLFEGKYIKTHYPPGPHWLAGLYTKICGLGNLDCFRLFPTTFGIFSLFLFAWILLSNLDPVKSAIFMFALAVVPTTTNTMHGLDYEGYAPTLFLIQLGLYIEIFRKKLKLNKLYLFILFLLGFIQGWLTFDFIILVSLSAIPFALLYSSLAQREDKRRLILALLAPTIGFGFAQFIHLIQVYIYYGNIKTVFDDIFRILSTRFGSAEDAPFSKISRIKLVYKYLFHYSGQKKFFFIVHLPTLLGITLLLLWIKEARLIIQRPFQITLKWTSYIRNYYAISAAFFVSCLLMFVMKEQFYYHPHLHTRHLFLLYFVTILTLIENISAEDFNSIA